MKTLDKILTKVDTSLGAPMGRSNIGDISLAQGKLYDTAVPMQDEAYDTGGAYWGIGEELRVMYDKELNFVSFYRVGDILFDSVYFVHTPSHNKSVDTRAEADQVWKDYTEAGEKQISMLLNQQVNGVLHQTVLETKGTLTKKSV